MESSCIACGARTSLVLSIHRRGPVCACCSADERFAAEARAVRATYWTGALFFVGAVVAIAARLFALLYAGVAAARDVACATNAMIEQAIITIAIGRADRSPSAPTTHEAVAAMANCTVPSNADAAPARIG